MYTLLCTIVSLVQSLYVEYHILICIVSLSVIIGQILINHLSQIKLAIVGGYSILHSGADFIK